ncbi:MAG: SDR family NAD(P)-dependent oxidoreductase, partial [Sphingobium sp.]|nr:SDR family NAD(P)-dependent oxidoreductase [Sphingobium sp.]
MKLLEGKTVLVTGASTGIGRAAAIGAAQHGADVAINYANSDGPAASCVAEIEALGQRAIAVKGDVADPQTAQDFVAKAVDAFGKVD